VLTTNARFGQPGSAGRGDGALCWPVPPDLMFVAIVSCAFQPDRVGAYVTGFSSGGAIRFLSDPVRKRDAALLSITSARWIEGLVVTSFQLKEIGRAHHRVSGRCAFKSALWGRRHVLAALRKADGVWP
jgi:hypothetical protein